MLDLAPVIYQSCLAMASKPINHPYLDIRSITSPNQCLAWWLVHSFLYYRFNQPVISDRDFDTLTSWVKMSWDQIDHQHKHLVTLDDLNAGSGFNITFPRMTQQTAYHVLREIRNNPARQPDKKQVRKAPQVKPNKTDKTFSEYDSLFS